MEEIQKRQVAIKVRVSDIQEGTYVKGEGWNPNYVLTKAGNRISRVNLIAAIVSIQPGTPNSTYIVDDGSGTISIRPFEELSSLGGAVIGDIINIIGKPREYGSERYVVPEIARVIRDEIWIKIRQKELEQEDTPKNGPAKPAAEAESPIDIESIEEVQPLPENPFKKIYHIIKTMDSGDGAPIEGVIKAADLHNTEEIIGELLKEGEIFEIKSGRLKVLE